MFGHSVSANNARTTWCCEQWKKREQKLQSGGCQPGAKEMHKFLEGEAQPTPSSLNTSNTLLGPDQGNHVFSAMQENTARKTLHGIMYATSSKSSPMGWAHFPARERLEKHLHQDGTLEPTDSSAG